MKVSSGKFTLDWMPLNGSNLITEQGVIPKGYDLVITEKESLLESAMVLYGWDEVGVYDSTFDNPVYGFMSNLEIGLI